MTTPSYSKRYTLPESTSAVAKPTRRDGLSDRWHILLFCICALTTALRQLCLLNHPAFYAEDGAIWYLDAYTLGWLRPLFSPAGGYLNTLPRLVADLALLLPFAWAPLFMNLVGLAVQVLPVNALLLRRSTVWGPLSTRALMALVYLVLPNVAEIHVVLTNAHFHLAVLALLLVVALPSVSLSGRVLDVFVLGLSGLSDPFCFPLLPVAVVVWWTRRNRWSLAVVAVEAVAVLTQVLELALGAGRPTPSLGASLHRFLLILGGQVYAGALSGRGAIARYPYWLLVVLSVLCSALLVYCLVKATLPYRLLLAFGGMLFVSAMLRPLAAPGTRSVWVMLVEGGAARYWFFPMLAFAWCLVWCATESSQVVMRVTGAGALLWMAWGAVHDWRIPEFPDRHFEASADRLAAAHEGDLVTVPIFPAWKMRLDKKGPDCLHPPMSALDAPPQPAIADKTLRVGGWLVAGEPISAVAIAIDGQVVKTEPNTYPRPDIDRIWPLSGNRQKGWMTELDISRLAPGEHQITVRALEADGCRAEVESFPLTKPAVTAR